MDTINLIPKSFLDRQVGELRARLIIKVTLALLIVTACVWLVLIIATYLAQDEIVEPAEPLHQEIIALSQRIKAREDDLRRVREGIDARIKSAGDKLLVISVIDAVARNVPAGVTLGTMRVSRGAISLRGVARDRSTISEMASKIAAPLGGPSIIIERLEDVEVDRDLYQEFWVSQRAQRE